MEIGYVVCQGLSGMIIVDILVDPTETDLECVEVDLERTLTKTLGWVGDEVETVRIPGYKPKFARGTLSISSAVPESDIQALLSRGFEVGQQLSR